MNGILKALISMFIGGAVVFTLFHVGESWHIRNRFEKGTTLSAEQIQSVGRAVENYTQQTGRRPDRMEQLVESDLLSRETLYDASRSEIPQIDPETGRFTENPDVIYFPGLSGNDPGDLVMLFTLLLHEKGDPYQVIYNDGRHAEVTGRELIMALNRTYRYLAVHRLGINQPATQP